ncbi:MAG TPA: Crp/Fnr family transcriptional regulator [Candidatus Acidoferrum sp.]|nr:Crp/Fnr family transcriptional regulator [Candidatus Acidoferrum sp.]
MRHILASSQLFSQLDEHALNEVASATTLRTVERNELIFFEGDRANAFYIVGKGKVKVYKMSPDGKEQILMIASKGDSFAEAALFSGGKFPASAQALEDSQLAVINRERFVALLAKDPDLAANLIARLSTLLRRLTALVEELSLTDVTTRLAHHLVTLIKPDDGPNPRITLSEKKAVMASMLGTIPETFSRSLARLMREKVISVEGPVVQVLDLKKLKELAGE